MPTTRRPKPRRHVRPTKPRRPATPSASAKLRIARQVEADRLKCKMWPPRWVLDELGISNATLWRARNNPTSGFPTPYRTGPNAIRFDRDEILAYKASKRGVLCSTVGVQLEWAERRRAKAAAAAAPPTTPSASADAEA